jgi:dTMP kinase
MFISLDGIDGGGKSTQIERLADWLHEERYDVFTCRDPGSTRLGEVVREILLAREEIPLAVRSEMFLYMAARAQLVDEAIRPALAAGKIVVCDRFLLANVVYQGHAGGLDPATLWQVGAVATDGLEPDRTFVLDLPIELAATRLKGERDRLEKRGDDYRGRLRQGFLDEANRRGDQIEIVDATQSVDAIAEQIRASVEKLLAGRGDALTKRTD